MLNLKRNVLAAVVAMGMSTHAFALFDLQLLAGKKFATFEDDNAGSSDEDIDALEIEAAAHLSPIPLVPVSFGLFYLLQDYDHDSVDEVKGWQLGAEVMGWLRIPTTSFSLFAKAGYKFLGNVQGKDTGYDAKWDVTGTRLAAGVKWSPIALVSAVLQLDYTMDAAKTDEINLAGVKTTSGADFDIKSYSILAGVSVGI